MQEKKRITVLGSTGSIGTQTMDVIRAHADRFQIVGLACGRNIARLREQIREFRPSFVSVQEKSDRDTLASEFPGLPVYYGEEGLLHAAEADCDIVLNSLMGIRGLLPTLHAIDAGHDIALANKETLVTGGHLVMRRAEEHGVKILPVDSEHSAIFQSLQGNRGKKIRRILLTCSGGPFRGWKKEQLSEVTPEMALVNPNWTMGKKITIDSATLMNKGLEMIEAKWLFNVPMDRITVLIHPESIVHSGVEFMDTAVIAELGVPDMRVPISVALGYPDRMEMPSIEPLDFFSGKARNLHFEEPDLDTFDCLKIAQEAEAFGGSAPVILNAANEVLVQAFLDRRIGFLSIPDGIRKMLRKASSGERPSLSEILETDQEVRRCVKQDLL
ncbi:MAG: 1-deoxy-D-xylulose-5-phosphate reductoisomerase [Eubacteriales bacterium]|nr:1-deoxy-D-xylulose-5-phosphate reductoisomerase [Eubacteriales bacterium]